MRMSRWSWPQFWTAARTILFYVNLVGNEPLNSQECTCSNKSYVVSKFIMSGIKPSCALARFSVNENRRIKKIIFGRASQSNLHNRPKNSNFRASIDETRTFALPKIGGGGAQTHLCPQLLKVGRHVPPCPPFSYALDFI